MTLSHKVTIVVSLFCSSYKNITANLPIPHKILSFVLFSAIKSNTGDFPVEEIRILMASPLMEAQGEQNSFKTVFFFTLFSSEEEPEN